MSLKAKAVSGIKWTSLSMVVVTTLGFLKLIVLGRLLGPEVFGLIGMVMVVVGFVDTFGDMGISNAIIHRQDATRKQLSSLYWLNILVGVFIFLVVTVANPFIVSFYEEPQIKIPLQWLSLSFIIMPVGLQFKLLLQKELKFNTIAKIDMCSLGINIATAIVLAIYNYGIYSLVTGQLVGVSLKTFLYMITGWQEHKPALYFNFKEIKDFLGFGLYQIGERIAFYFSTNIDYIIIGKFLGAFPLGIYTLAYKMVVIPQTRINPVITSVMFPIFSKIQNDNSRLAKGYLKIISLVATISLPLLTGLAILSPLIIPLLWGDQWLPAIPIIQILSIMGALKALGNPIGSILLAKGRADIGFKLHIVYFFIYLFLFLYVAQFGIVYIAIAHVIIPLFTLPIGLTILHFLINLDIVDFSRTLIKPLVGSFLMGAIMCILCFLISTRLKMGFLVLGVLIILGFAVFIVFNFVFNKIFFNEIVDAIKSKREIIENQT